MELQDLASGLSILHDDPGVGAVYFGEMSFLGMDKAAPVLAEFAARAQKPFVVCWQGGPYTEIIREGLRERGVVAFDTPAVAMRALKAAHDYGCMMATPAPEAPSRGAARLAAANEGLMAEAEAYALLADCGIDVARWRLAATPAEAAAAARTLGDRVALKGQAPGIAHKSEHGLVRLNLDASEVEAAATEMGRRVPAIESFLVQEMAPKGVEMLAGIVTDPHVGPAVVLGFGGIYAEAMGPPAVEVAPIDGATARAMIARIDRKNVLGGYRTGRALAKDALAELMVSLSRLAHEERARLREADLNPVIVGERRALAVDALLRLGSR
jgi:acyl-CoA synthetase (NDP forming)